MLKCLSYSKRFKTQLLLGEGRKIMQKKLHTLKNKDDLWPHGRNRLIKVKQAKILTRGLL